ncbi:MAG: phenylalanine--tRNA ligase subunit beta [Candidatus Daviesbacteria bacterium]|nr:phenylalanine--tRNA ligase subunit beta [Candidatus Daviesbacteria bacterium]
MRVSLSWLKELVNCNLSPQELADKLSLISIGIKNQTQDYLELDLTYNRGDLLSMRGVAREVAAVTDSELLFSNLKPPTYPCLPETPVQVDNKSLCPVYCVAKIEGIKIKPSSDQWVKKLTDCGVRSVNNIADVTNLIMLEYDQPMHAFDASQVKDGMLIVRTAKQDEKIMTLDGKDRTLDETDLLITDSEKALALAGVMGGKNSEVTEKTTTILLEAAIFDPVFNRKSSKKHGLYSEATKRFQHGLTKTNLLQALSAAIKMYEGLGGKLTAITFTGNLQDQVKTIQLTRQKINSLIGVDIPPEEAESSLKKLGFRLEAKHLEGEKMRLHLRGGMVWNVTVPYWRLDISIEEDLVEEVARMYGYEKIPPKTLEGNLPEKIDQSFPNFIYDLKKSLKEAGLTEVQTYSFYSTGVLNNLDRDKNNLVKIANPISSETEYLRDNLWPNLLEVAAKNIRNGIKDIAIFELGKIYTPQKGDLPHENYHLAIALCNDTDNPIQELNQIFQQAQKHLRGEKMQLHLGGGKSREYFHPTRYTDGMAEIHPRFVNKFGIDQRVAVLEIELNPLTRP